MKQRKKVKVTVTFEMDELTAKLFLQSSIERVINTSIRIVEKYGLNNYDARANLEDWNEWSPVVSGMWIAIHYAIYLHFNAQPVSDRVFDLHKGDL